MESGKRKMENLRTRLKFSIFRFPLSIAYSFFPCKSRLTNLTIRLISSSVN